MVTLQSQRTSNSLKSQDFRKEVGVHHAPDHLSPKAVLDGMTLEKCHRESPQPTEIVAQRSFANATVVLAKVHVQHPVHRLDPPMTPNRFAESLAAEITAHNVVASLVRFIAVGVLSQPQCVANCLHPRPLLFDCEVEWNPVSYTHLTLPT